jgi:hypothetical protein
MTRTRWRLAAAPALLALAALLLLVAACNHRTLGSPATGRQDSEDGGTSDEAPYPQPIADEAEASWNILVYMNGDNDLDPAAMEDLNELEAGMARVPDYRVLVLLDRSATTERSEQAWSDTRLLRVLPDPNGLSATVVSRKREAPELGLRADGRIELNMGDETTLKQFLAAGDAYPARHTALVLWGHGDGYRAEGASAPVAQQTPPSRAVGVDQSSGDDSLTTAEIGRALADHGVQLIGLDLCYGAMIEIACELQDAAALFVASQEVVTNDGWEYDLLLDKLGDSRHEGSRDTAAGPEVTPAGFADAVVNMFRESNARRSGSAISAVRLERIEALVASFDALAVALAEHVDTAERRSELRALLFEEVEAFYRTPGSLDLDIGDLAGVVAARYPVAAQPAGAVQSALTEAVMHEWHHESGHPRATGLSVHYVPLDSSGFPATHADTYFRDALAEDQTRFVRNSGWPPSREAEDGLLYRLWYEDLP